MFPHTEAQSIPLTSDLSTIKREMYQPVRIIDKEMWEQGGGGQVEIWANLFRVSSAATDLLHLSVSLLKSVYFKEQSTYVGIDQ